MSFRIHYCSLVCSVVDSKAYLNVDSSSKMHPQDWGTSGGERRGSEVRWSRGGLGWSQVVSGGLRWSQVVSCDQLMDCSRMF